MQTLGTEASQTMETQRHDDKNKRLKLTKQVSVSSFFKEAEKSNESTNSQKTLLSSFASQKQHKPVNYIHNCPWFALLNDPRFKYDIEPVWQSGAKITLTDGAKF